MHTLIESPPTRPTPKAPVLNLIVSPALDTLASEVVRVPANDDVCMKREHEDQFIPEMLS